MVSEDSDIEQFEPPIQLNQLEKSDDSDEDTEEETVQETAQIFSVVKHSKTFKNIIPVNENKDIYVDDWVLVLNQTIINLLAVKTKNINFMYYIGQIIKQKNKSTFEGTLLRTKTSRDHKGMVYRFSRSKRYM